ncbi:hypothetical protein GPN2_13025 [Streptomyces murinus]
MQPHRAEDLHDRGLRDLVLDALGAIEVERHVVVRRVLEAEGEGLAVARALALLRAAARPRPGVTALDAGRGGEGGGLLVEGDGLLVRLGVAAVDPPGGGVDGDLVGVLRAAGALAADDRERGVVGAAVLVVVGRAPLGLVLGGARHHDQRLAVGGLLVLEAHLHVGRLGLPVRGHVIGDAPLGVHHDLPARHGRLLALRGPRVVGRGGAGRRPRRRLAALCVLAVRLVVLAVLGTAEDQHTGHTGGDDHGGGRDDRDQLRTVAAAVAAALRGLLDRHRGRLLSPLGLLLPVRAGGPRVLARPRLLTGSRLLTGPGVLAPLRVLLVPRLLVRIRLLLITRLLVRVLLRVLRAPGRLLIWPHGRQH